MGCTPVRSFAQDLGYACPVTLWGYDTTSSQVALAALFEQITTVHVKGYPENDKVQPDYLNIFRIATPAQILELTRQRSQVNVLDQKKKRITSLVNDVQTGCRIRGPFATDNRECFH